MIETRSAPVLATDRRRCAEIAPRPATRLACPVNPGESDPSAGAVIWESAAMRRAMELAKRAAGADITVLLSGETGTGKSLLAGFLHRYSKRRDAPFVAQNCGALPEALCESELFGYQRGAFSGAVQDKPGLFEAADGGTIFLDEISEVGLAAQVKLLQVLQEGVLRRLGDTRSRSVDVRVIAATNKDLCVEIQRGSFREDLYYRLNVVSIVVPSLRERPEDIPRLAAHFLRKAWPADQPKGQPARRRGARPPLRLPLPRQRTGAGEPDPAGPVVHHGPLYRTRRVVSRARSWRAGRDRFKFGGPGAPRGPQGHRAARGQPDAGGIHPRDQQDHLVAAHEGLSFVVGAR